MTTYQLIKSADSLETALDIVRDEIINTIVDRATLHHGHLDTVIQPHQFIQGKPYAVKGVQLLVDEDDDVFPVALLEGHDSILLQEASTPVLTAILAII